MPQLNLHSRAAAGAAAANPRLRSSPAVGAPCTAPRGHVAWPATCGAHACPAHHAPLEAAAVEAGPHLAGWFQPTAAQWLPATSLLTPHTQQATSLWQPPVLVSTAGLHAFVRPDALRMAVLEKKESPSEAKRQDEERRKQQEYYANVGDAIRTLREEIPRLFIQDLTWDIYRDDVVFKDPRNTVRGLPKYKRIFRGLRLLGRVAFTRCWVDVKRIWQPESNRISLRWQFHGVPRIPWEVQGVFDGVSEFRLDSDGKVYEHKVTNVVLRDPPLGISPLWNSLARVFSREPVPCPGINFQDADGALFANEYASLAQQWVEARQLQLELLLPRAAPQDSHLLLE